MADNLTGGCLCGAVRFTLAEPPNSIGACHCGMCRKQTGSVSFGIHVEPGGITFQSDATIKVRTTSQWAERAFCVECGSYLFWRMTAPGPEQGMLAVSAGALDSLDGLILTEEIYVDHKPAGYAFAGDHKRLTEAETIALFTAPKGN